MADYKPARIAYKCFVPVSGVNHNTCPVIFLHGVTSTKDAWLDMPQVIADKTKRTTYALDARNHGDSEFNDIFDFDVGAIDLIHFMDTMNISKAALVGQSMGGMTAMKVALKEPEKVEMFFAAEIVTCKIPTEFIDSIYKLMEIEVAATKVIPSGLSKNDALKYLAYRTQDKIEKEQKVKSVYKIENMLNGRRALRSKPDGTYDVCFNKDAFLPFLKNYDKLYKDLSGNYFGPAFFIYGSTSLYNTIKCEARIKKLFPKAELIEFEGASHDVVGDCWEKFIETVLAGLNK